MSEVPGATSLIDQFRFYLEVGGERMRVFYSHLREKNRAKIQKNLHMCKNFCNFAANLLK